MYVYIIYDVYVYMICVYMICVYMICMYIYEPDMLSRNVCMYGIRGMFKMYVCI